MDKRKIIDGLEYGGQCAKYIERGTEPIDAALAELEKPEERDAQIDRAYSMLEAHGVPRERAKSVANGIDVLATRLGKEINANEAQAAVLAETLKEAIDRMTRARSILHIDENSNWGMLDAADLAPVLASYHSGKPPKTYISCRGCFWNEGGLCYLEPCERGEGGRSVKLAEGGCPKWANTLAGIRKEPEPPRKVVPDEACNWHQAENDCFRVACNGQAMDGDGDDPDECGWVYCPYCGRKINYTREYMPDSPPATAGR